MEQFVKREVKEVKRKRQELGRNLEGEFRVKAF